MTDISAAIGIVQLKKLKNYLKLKEQVAKTYNKNFLNFEEIQTPFIPTYVNQHSWYCYTIKVKKKHRNKLIKYLKK